MNKKTIVCLSATVLLTAVSCKTISRSQTSDSDFLKVTKQPIFQKPLVCDLDVAQNKKSIQVTFDNVTLEEAKERALAEFIKNQNCDLVVQPFFTTSTASVDATRSQTVVILTGHAATYRNIRNMEPKDTLRPIQYSPANNKVSVQEKKIKP